MAGKKAPGSLNNWGVGFDKSPFDHLHLQAETLTRREREILAHLSGDQYEREIAESFNLAPNSIKSYTRRIYAKLGVSDRQEAIQRASQLGLLDNQAPPKGRRHNLPAPLTPFIGRQNELHQIGRMLADPVNRLVTLTGTGGIGKTRLALQVANACQDNYLQGVWLMTLASLSEPELVTQFVAAALDLHSDRARNVLEELVDYLSAKQLLLVVDNCEHLVAACASLASALLQRCPNLQILATSREALGIAGECTYQVPSLSFPKSDRVLNSSKLMKYEAVDLFIRRAKSAQPAFDLNKHNARAVLQICSRLDGIPLALELAAARLKVMDVEEIAGELDDRFNLLRGGDRTAPVRLQTMRASIDWSYTLLPETEKQLLRAVSVFAGSWSLAAARAVCACLALPGADITEMLEGLVNKSLVLVQRVRGRKLRYRVLETVRQYAAGKASQAGEVAALRDRHLAYYATFSGQAAVGMAGTNPIIWLRRLDDEMDNLRLALEWALATDVEAGLQLIIQIDFFWIQRGHVREQYDWINSFLDRPESQALPRLRARALEIESNILFCYLGDPLHARSCAETSLNLARDLEDRKEEAGSLYQLGYIAANQGEASAGRKLYEESLALFRTVGDKVGQARVLAQLGYMASGIGEDGAAFTEQSLALCREAGDQANIALRLKSLATLHYRKCDYANARQLIEEALTIQRRLELKYDLVESLDVFGRVAFRLGDPVLARTSYLESIALNDKLGRSGENIWPRVDLAYLDLQQGRIVEAQRGFVDCLSRVQGNQNIGGVRIIIEGLASLAVAEGRLEHSACLYAWADCLLQKSYGLRPANEQADVEQDFLLIHSGLDEPARQAAEAKGISLTLEQAIVMALAEKA
jgi:predicted ATPase/DNA-binding CsgD family transcriptional regulator